MTATVRRSGPHIESRESVRRSMWEVAGALLPVTAAATIFFGPWSLYLVFASAAAAAVLERPFTPGGFSWQSPLGDGSAFLAGMLFGLTLPPGSPWWMPFFGAVVVVFVAKLAFGGIGHNVFNPALVARAVVLIGFPAMATEWRVPLQWDAVTTATPLEGGAAGYLELFLGTVPGSIGETSVLALLIGASYLFARGFVGWRISVFYLGSAALTALALGVDPLFTVLSGSLMFAALFMSTDMVTSPVARSARAVYGIGCGVLTVLIREFSVYPEGVTFAVLLMNGLTPLIDVTVVDTFFGQVEKRRRRVITAAAIAGVAVVAGLAGVASTEAGRFATDFYVDGVVRRDIRLFFPEGRYAAAAESHVDGVTVEQVFSREEAVGYLAYSTARGYGGPIRIVLAMNPEKRIIGARIVEQNESPTLGSLIRRPSFLSQFIGLSTAFPQVAVDNLQAITGATTSSRAVASAIESALRFDREPERRRGMGEISDGTFTGRAGGYQGAIAVEVTVSGGRISAIEVAEHRETARLADPAFRRLIDAVVSQQSLDVDTVSGATGTSRGFLAAVRDAVE